MALGDLGAVGCHVADCGENFGGVRSKGVTLRMKICLSPSSKTPNFVLGDTQILQLLFFAFVAFFHAFHQATNVVGGTFAFVCFYDVINGAHLVEGAVVNPDCGVAELG